jgi:hypothetical protein
VALLATVGLMSWTSHQGGKLTPGTDYLTEHMPTAMRSVLGVTVGRVDSGVDPASFYATRVHPIFVDRCLLCHSSEKHKGGLRLDSYQNVMRGGKDGKVIQPGTRTRVNFSGALLCLPTAKTSCLRKASPR